MKDEEYNVANFATLLSKTLIFSLPKMDEFNFSRFLKDENEILQAKDQHSRDFPTFRVHFGEFFLTIFFLLKLKTRAIPTASTESARNEENQELPQESDVSRFPIISSDEIHELCEVALVYSELIPLIRIFAPVDDFSENTNNSKDCGLQFFSNLDRYGVRCIT